ncbi:hypothetical protein ACFLWZ_07840, partial [Chloroflexota bacterium]
MKSLRLSSIISLLPPVCLAIASFVNNLDSKSKLYKRSRNKSQALVVMTGCFALIITAPLCLPSLPKEDKKTGIEEGAVLVNSSIGYKR